MPDPIPTDERTALLVALAEIRGQLTQALSQLTAHSGRMDNHDTRLRVVETVVPQTQQHETEINDLKTKLQAMAEALATWRGRSSILGLLGGGVIALIVSVIANQVGG